jgi:preprotein translocase subunit Sss1
MSKPSSLLDSRWLAFEMGHQSVYGYLRILRLARKPAWELR